MTTRVSPRRLDREVAEAGDARLAREVLTPREVSDRGDRALAESACVLALYAAMLVALCGPIIEGLIKLLGGPP